MLELKFAHDYQAAIYDRFVLTIFKAATEESTSEQVSLSICISLQRLFCRSTGSSRSVQWVFWHLNAEHLNKPPGGGTILRWTHLPWELGHEKHLYFL